MITISDYTFNDYYNEIKKNVKITEVFERLGLKIYKRGKYYKTLCPFHKETNPSLVIYKESYHCFGCNAHGDIFTVISQIKGYSFYDTVAWLEGEFPYIKSYKPKEKKALVKPVNAFDIAFNCYSNMSDKEKLGLEYFANNRKYDSRYLQDAEIFYVTGNKLLKYTEDNIEMKQVLLEKKLLKEKVVDYDETKSERSFLQDTFINDRVVITLRDYNNSIVGFAGRAIKDEPKYLFTQDLQKNNLLYRLNVVKEKCKNDEEEVCELYLTEGIFDALRLEFNGFYAVSVLGSQITKDQVKILDTFIKDMTRNKKGVILYLFLDSDNAGLKGAFDSIKNLWRNKGTRKTIVNIVVNKEKLAGKNQDILTNESKDEKEFKDPDEILRDLNYEESVKWIKNNTIDVFEFLIRYLYDSENLIYDKRNNSIENAFSEMDIVERLSVMVRMKSILSEKIWREILEYYEIIETDSTAFQKFFRFIHGMQSEGTKEKTPLLPETTEEDLFLRAISIAKNSYEREETVLDDFSWDRIQYCADIFIPYFKISLMNQISTSNYNYEDKVPMLAIRVPKKNDEFRLKMQYIHEQLILQQYVLNELLSSNKDDPEYEKLVPAVRYDKMTGRVYTTGFEYYDFYKKHNVETVSFAYQIDMMSVNGITTGEGMYRPFYECWRSFIEYIKDGIKSIEGELVYKVRLDIRKFYDRIPLYAVRNMLVSQLRQALTVRGDKFSKILTSDSNQHQIDNDSLAEKLADWLDNQAFGNRYYDTKNGDITNSENGLFGVPQGPNLSSYLANIILFPMDKRITEYVSMVNDNGNDNEQSNKHNNDNCKKIHVRYARYVDDMVIVSDDPKHLHAIRDIIVNELQKLGLELSPKTDEAEEISKRDALNWLLDERGGLGVSSLFDFPDDSLDTIFDQYEYYDTINRRDALKLLNNFMFDPNQIDDDKIFYSTIESIFKTDEVRYNDVVRLSETIIRYVIRKSDEVRRENLLEEYEKTWVNYTKVSPPNSMFRRNGICFLSFIDGLIRILRPDNRLIKNFDEQKLDKSDRVTVISFVISKNLFEILDEKIINNDGVLLLNNRILYQKLLQIIDLSIRNLPDENQVQQIGCRIKISDKAVDNLYISYKDRMRYLLNNSNNEYERRWIYSLYTNFISKGIGEDLLSDITQLIHREMTLNGKPLFRFHFFVTRLLNCKKLIDYKDTRDQFSSIDIATIKDLDFISDLSIFDQCLLLWFDHENVRDNEKYGKIALKSLINIIDKRFIASVLHENRILKKYLFNGRQDLRYLPVPPGVNYSGIFAISVKNEGREEKTGKSEKEEVLRADLNNNKLGEHYLGLRWSHLRNTIDKVHLYKANIKGDIWLSLDEYFRKYEIPSSDLVYDVSKIYRKLMNFLIEEKENDKLVISKYHVFLDKNDNIRVLSYKSESESNVAISNGSNSLKLELVNHIGNTYWKVGLVLKDALSIGNVILRDKDYSTLMLISTLKRLCGYYEYAKIESAEKSVERALQLLDNFPEDEKAQQIYVLNSNIVNSFIEYRKNNYWDDGSIVFHLYRWSQKCLDKYYKELKSIFDEIGVVSAGTDIIKRRSSWSYFSIAHNINNLVQTYANSDGATVGFEALMSGLYISSVMENIRMQVLERIVALRPHEAEGLNGKGLQDSLTEVITKNSDKNINLLASISNDHLDEFRSIVGDLLGKKYPESIKYLTLEGWLVLLRWVLEIDTSSKYVTSLRIKKHDEIVMQEVRKKLNDLNEKFLLAYSDEKSTNESVEYPFDIVQKAVRVWNEKLSIEMFEILNSIDDLDNVVVEAKSSRFFSKIIERTPDAKLNKVSLDLDGLRIHDMPYYFLTEAHFGKTNRVLEHNEEGEIVWTQTIIGNEICGVSAISSVVYDLVKIRRVENENYSHSICNESYKNAISNKEENELGGKEDKSDKEEENKQLEENKKSKSTMIGNEDQLISKDNAIDEDFNEIIKHISQLQIASWEKRRKIFKTLDRIALFQFDVDDSYQHPISEVCLDQYSIETHEVSLCEKNMREIKKNPEKWNAVVSKEGILKLRSCAEFRRRKLLEKVFEVCNIFEVDILLLPEYSVRPETVMWMLDHIIRKEYKFSVWAGTFRIVPGYLLDKNAFQDLYDSTAMEIDPLNYWAAVLPIICNKQNDEVLGVQKKDLFPRIIAQKYKKYPAISLQEFINPFKASRGPIKPIAKTFDKATIFGDARDDVIELICSELFIMMNPSNIQMFTLASYKLYNIFSKSKCEYKDYLEGTKNDIIEFGNWTAINNSKGKYSRTPIILVPAYTTRAIDYYVAGQAGYLSSGITTVFCNAVGPKTEGGSCFIGTDCWDNRDGNVSSYMPDYSPYHGVIPGIYKQFYEFRDRGGLGREEQALLICDINPTISFTGKPNPQSLGKCLELVAHLPIIESHVSKRIDIDKNVNKQRGKGCRCKISKQRIMSKCDKAIMGITDLYRYYLRRESDANSYVLTVQDKTPDKMKEALVKIGEAINSEWMIRRGEAYLMQHINNPREWPPPTVLDWLWVNVDYEKEYGKSGDEYCIEVPVFTEAELKEKLDAKSASSK